MAIQDTELKSDFYEEDDFMRIYQKPIHELSVMHRNPEDNFHMIGYYLEEEIEKRKAQEELDEEYIRNYLALKEGINNEQFTNLQILSKYKEFLEQVSIQRNIENQIKN